MKMTVVEMNSFRPCVSRQTASGELCFSITVEMVAATAAGALVVWESIGTVTMPFNDEY